ncbi:MAG: transposase family protein [Kineosporiaceae bacterium]|nr:transposase family protein [Aeromicrobium sp.]
MDSAPAQVVATLMDEGSYLASESTMYRILASQGEVRERRRQLTHPKYARPELLAIAPNEVWSWDITKLLGPVKWSYYYLYSIMDIYSRYEVGWMIAERETGLLAERLISETILKQGITRDQLTLQADRGAPMTSKQVAHLLADLGVTKSHSRPYTSTDNPYSEAQFKTLKYRPQFPGRFDSIDQARAFCQEFFRWYNLEHRHSGIGMMTPHAMHHGLAEGIHNERAIVLDAVYQQHPERFVNRPPIPPTLPTAAWINKPKEQPPPDHTAQ